MSKKYICLIVFSLVFLLAGLTACRGKTETELDGIQGEVWRNNIERYVTIEIDGWWTGHGFILKDKYILTAAHLFREKEEKRILFYNQLITKNTAKVIFFDKKDDIALLEIQGAPIVGLPDILLGEPDELKISEPVYYFGIHTAIRDNREVIIKMLKQGVIIESDRIAHCEKDQFFAFKGPIGVAGESGGPVFDAEGRLIGIISSSSAILSGSDTLRVEKYCPEKFAEHKNPKIDYVISLIKEKINIDLR